MREKGGLQLQYPEYSPDTLTAIPRTEEASALFGA